MSSPSRSSRWEEALRTILTMTRRQPEPPALDPRIVQELQVTLAARQELGPEYDPELIKVFLAHIQTAIEQRIDALWHERERRRRRVALGKGLTLVLVFLAAIPLTLVAGLTAGATGIAAVWIGLVVLVVAAGYVYRV